jgi:50S ribosomal protein L16 3-hydroxylase
MKKMTLLGGLTPARFLQEYWHKKPLLVRQALPALSAPLSHEELFALASKDDVESRLITHFDNEWQLKNGPFVELPSIDKKNWTLLVQGANLHDDAADALLRQFRFLPDARLDDLMISYATEGGGVGPHFDSYDVFLLQVHGQRRWRIGAQQDLTLVKGMPLKILQHFTPDEEFILEPGDMLYLPPHYAHDGVALGDCMTCSVGFRAPSFQELGEAFLQFMADSIDLPGRYGDADLTSTTRPAEIGGAMLGTIATELNKVRFTEDDITIFVGEYLSEPKPSIFFESPEKPISFAKFIAQAKKRGVRLSRKTRMLYRGKHVFINGESFSAGRADKEWLVNLANHRMLAGDDVGTASKDVIEALYTWYEDGWLYLV